MSKLTRICCSDRYTLTIVKGLPQITDSSEELETLASQPQPQRSLQHGRSSSVSVASMALSEAEQGIEAVVKRHVNSSQLLSRAAGEISFRLPKAEASK